MSRMKAIQIPFTPRWSVGNSEKARKDAAAIQKVVRNARSSVPSSVENLMLSEVKVENAVTTYFSEPKFAKFSVVRECEIQIGPSSYKADIVLRDEEGNFITIAECKSQRGPNHRPEPLKSYLCATDTSYGIFAPSTNRDSWIFYENLRHNRFRQIERSDFEKGILELSRKMNRFSGSK